MQPEFSILWENLKMKVEENIEWLVFSTIHAWILHEQNSILGHAEVQGLEMDQVYNRHDVIILGSFNSHFYTATASTVYTTAEQDMVNVTHNNYNYD